MLKELDLLLVKPGNQKKLYGDLSYSFSAIEPPLWAGLIASFVREHDFSVKIIDAEAENLNPNSTADKIIEYDPLLVGVIISGTNPSASTQNMPAAYDIIAALKDKMPSIKTFLAGLHPSALPERTIKEGKSDFICQGEGFYTIPKLINTLRKGSDNYEIDGLSYIKNSKVISNPRAPLIHNLDTLPPIAWDLLPMDKYRAHNWHCFQDIEHRKPYAIIYTSLGCPFNCNFCCINSIFGEHTIRYRSPEKVIEEIDLLVKKYHVKNIKIIDEMFALKEEHVTGLCDLIIQRGYDLNIWAYARIDTINERMLKKMKQAGINWLAFGIESGSKKVRNGVSKGRFNQDDIRKAINMTKNAGINIGANFIFGLPDDDLETMQETLNLAKELNCEYTNFYVAMAFPGSKLYDEAIKNNIKLPENWLGYAQFSEETLPLSTKYISSADVLRFRDNPFKEFHSNLKYINMITEKFGPKTAEHIREMLKHDISRKYA